MCSANRRVEAISLEQGAGEGAVGKLRKAERQASNLQ